MKMRAMVTLAVVVLMLTMVGACGKGDKALDVAGLNLGKDLTSKLGDLTKMLGGITDLDSAKAALPKLDEMTGGLDDIAAKAGNLSAESKEAFAGMVNKALPALEGAVSKLMEMPGVGDTLKPALDPIMAKIKGML